MGCHWCLSGSSRMGVSSHCNESTLTRQSNAPHCRRLQLFTSRVQLCARGSATGRQEIACNLNKWMHDTHAYACRSGVHASALQCWNTNESCAMTRWWMASDTAHTPLLLQKKRDRRRNIQRSLSFRTLPRTTTVLNDSLVRMQVHGT